MRTYLSMEAHLQAFLTLAQDGGEQSLPWPDCFTSREWTSSIHWKGGWVGTRAGLDMLARKQSQPKLSSL